MRHARCPMRRNKHELEWFSTTRCHLYNGASIKKHSSVMMFDYRCVSHKLGCDVWKSIDEWRVVDGRKETTHRLARTENSPVGASEFSLLGMRRECNQSVLWQLNCGFVCQQHGGRIESLNCIAYFFWELCLLALAGLVSAQRSQALTALTLKDILLSENGTRFCVSRLLKTSRPGKSSTPVMVPKNTSNGRLCPHTTFQTCIRRTESVSVKWYMKYIEVLTFSGFCMQLLKLRS